VFSRACPLPPRQVRKSVSSSPPTSTTPILTLKKPTNSSSTSASPKPSALAPTISATPITGSIPFVYSATKSSNSTFGGVVRRISSQPRTRLQDALQRLSDLRTYRRPRWRPMRDIPRPRRRLPLPPCLRPDPPHQRTPSLGLGRRRTLKRQPNILTLQLPKRQAASRRPIAMVQKGTRAHL